MPDVGFILYDSRSGSTLLASLLNRLSGVEVSLESAFSSRVFEYGLPLTCASDVYGLLEWLELEIQFRELAIDHSAVVACLPSDGPYSKAQILAALFANIFGNDHAEWWIVKHPPYLHAATVCELFPNVRFVHVIRDGRDVFLSKRTSRSVSGRRMQTNLIQAARDWSRKAAVAEALGERVHTVKFEELVADLEPALARVAEFLRLSNSGRTVVASQADYGRRIGDSQKHLHINVSSAPDGSRAGRWTAEMTTSDVWCYTWLARRTLDQYGYLVAAPCLPTSGREYTLMLLNLLRWYAHFVVTKVRNVVLRIRRGQGMRSVLRPPRSWVLARARRAAARTKGSSCRV